MVKVGVHVSIAGSIGKSVDRAAALGCDTFQIFSRSPRGWSFREIPPEEKDLFRKNLEKTGIYPPIDHMPYLPNLATGTPVMYEKSVATLTAELKRCEILGIPYLVTHLGHHAGTGAAEGRKRVIEAINTGLSGAESEVMLLLENTAGERNGIGNRFEDIRAVIEGISHHERIGCCFDTCHAFGAGYEIRTREGLEKTMRAFDEAIGLSRIRAVHLNDSKGDLGSGLDRHEHIGLGFIGEAGFAGILHHPVFRSVPLILETPVDARRGDEDNIRRVRELAA